MAKGFRWLLLLSTLAANPASQQQARTPDDDAIARGRAEYFRAQRAYPNATVSSESYVRALEAGRRLPSMPIRRANSGASAPLPAWRALGPIRISSGAGLYSGRVNDIAVSPVDPNVIYIAAAGGGAWKTTDGGVSWAPLTDTVCDMTAGAVAIDPTDPNVVFLGTGFWPYWDGCGMLRSIDGGATWTRLSPPTFIAPWENASAAIIKILIIPSVAHTPATSTIIAATTYGIFKSVDGGNTWTHPKTSGWYYPISGLVNDPTNPQIVYAAAIDFYAVNSTLTGVFTSIDAGSTWTRLNSLGLDFSDGRLAISGNPAVLYVSTTLQNVWQGISRSTDGGATWFRPAVTGVTEPLWIAANPVNAAIVYGEGVNLYRSTDSAKTFAVVTGTMHVDMRSIAFSTDGATIYAGTDGGPYRSTTGGASWTSLNGNLTITQLYPGLAIDRGAAPLLIAGTQDNGSNQYTGFPDWTNVGGGDGGYQAINYGPTGGRFTEYQWIPNSGYSGPWYVDKLGSYFYRMTGINASDRGTFIPPLIPDPVDPLTLYFGTYRVYKTTNGGLNWVAVSTDLSGGQGTIMTMAVSPADTRIVWIGTTDGVIQVSRDGGVSWNTMTNGIPNRTVTRITPDRIDPNLVYATVSGYGSGHVFRTVNGGTSWQDISGNLPDVPANVIASVPASGLLFVGTDVGLFASTNGTQWSAPASGLPGVIVTDLVFHQASGTLYAGTHGRGAYALTLGIPAAATFAAYGDVTGDNTVNIIDAQQIARFSVGLTVVDATLVQSRGDVTADNAINIIDAQQIARFSVGLSASARVNTTFAALTGTIALAFTPPSATVTAGGTVNFGFQATAHTVSFGGAAGAPADIGASSNTTVARQFNTAGTFGFRCTIHPSMTGSVLVLADPGATVLSRRR